MFKREFKKMHKTYQHTNRYQIKIWLMVKFWPANMELCLQKKCFICMQNNNKPQGTYDSFKNFHLNQVAVDEVRKLGSALGRHTGQEKCGEDEEK